MNVRKYYQYCAVPYCENNTIRTPTKLFVHVPQKSNIRKKWLELARMNVEDVSAKSNIFFCEDHFDLPNDMQNYMQYHILGYVNRVLMKHTCLPSKFAFQSDHFKRRHINILQDMVSKNTEMPATSTTKSKPLKHLESLFESKSKLNPTVSYNGSRVEKEMSTGQHEHNIQYTDTNLKECTITVKIERDDHLDCNLDTEDPLLDRAVIDSKMYVDHQIKEEIVIGPSVLHKPALNCKDLAIWTTVKIEREDDDHTEDPILNPAAIDSNMYEDQIKKGMVIGPSVEHKPVVNSKDALKEYKKKPPRKIYKSQNMISVHKAKVHKSKEKILEKCKTCFKTFTHIRNLRRHLEQFHIGNCTFTCDICNKKFKRKDYLVHHRKVVHYKIINGKRYDNNDGCNVKKSTCDICQKEFCSPRKLVRHLSYHRNIERNILHCDYCNKVFKNKDRLICHINTNHMAVSLPYTCVSCGKQYSMKQSLAKHLNSHTGNQFCCKFCNTYFRSKWGHRLHEKKCSRSIDGDNSKDTY